MQGRFSIIVPMKTWNVPWLLYCSLQLLEYYLGAYKKYVLLVNLFIKNLVISTKYPSWMINLVMLVLTKLVIENLKQNTIINCGASLFIKDYELFLTDLFKNVLTMVNLTILKNFVRFSAHLCLLVTNILTTAENFENSLGRGLIPIVEVETVRVFVSRHYDSNK